MIEKNAEKICVVGAGITGATIARFLADRGIASIVFEGRDHVAGNCHTTWDSQARCFQHVYGPHIFHTNSQEVVDWISRFTHIMPYKHSVKAMSCGRVYSLPINLHTLNQFFDQAHTPEQARRHLEKLADTNADPDASFESRALSLLGSDLYAAFLRGYTRKQWGVEPDQIPSDILKRLPVRFNYDDNYFFHKVQGLPQGGYTGMIEAMLDHSLISVEINTKVAYRDLAASYDRIFWSGPIEDIFEADEGYLPYRTLDFETCHVQGDAQGCPVMNYSDESVPYTRITQHNYFRSMLDTEAIEISLLSKEYSREWQVGDIQYYPVHLTGGSDLLDRYRARADRIDRLHLCGRLGQFKYMDMDVAMLDALQMMQRIFPT